MFRGNCVRFLESFYKEISRKTVLKAPDRDWTLNAEMSQRRIELGIHAERSKRHVTFVSGIPVFPLSRRWSLSTGTSPDDRGEISGKPVERHRYVSDGYPTGLFFHRLFFRYHCLKIPRNASKCLRLFFRMSGSRVESFNLVRAFLHHHTNTESKKKKTKKIFKFQNILNNAFDLINEKLIFTYSTIFFHQNFHKRYFPVVETLCQF